MTLSKLTKPQLGYKSKEDVVKVLSREHNLVIDQVNANDTEAAANTTAVAAALAGTAVTATNVGTAATGTTAVEYGDGNFHKTVLTIDTTLPAITGGVDQALGKLIYTLPAGAELVTSSYISLALDESDGNITTDTPDLGIGTTIGAGAVAVLGGTAGFENIATGTATADCNGTALVSLADITAGTNLPIHSGNPHIIHVNVAASWTAGGEAACGLAGTVILYWSFVV